jgi:putative oxygen-independent coproporphyrinogen III oxidase
VRVTEQAFGVYVHVPFCAARCDYCDFATWTDRTHLVHDYVAACVTDVERRQLPPATSVFFGGGTPSLLEASELTRVLAAIPRADGAEVTVECNPDSVSREKLAAYSSAGVNRLSFGVQSMRPHVLAQLGRTHDPANVERAVHWAHDVGITSVNVDLIYGTPGESLDDWDATLDAALALAPTHVSAYALTVEPGTPLGRAVAAGTRAAPDEDDQAAKYELADDRLGDAGFAWYEISNWARAGHECRHNRLYWEQGEYVGIGCAAHSHCVLPDGSARRSWNLRTPERYIAAVVSGGPTEAGDEVLDPAARVAERVTLALRTRDGIKLTDPAADFSRMPKALECVTELCEDGLLERHRPHARLTRRGRLLANVAVARLLMALEAPVATAGTR